MYLLKEKFILGSINKKLSTWLAICRWDLTTLELKADVTQQEIKELVRSYIL